MSILHGKGRVAAVLAAALLAGAMVYVLVTSLSPNRISDAAAADVALRDPLTTATTAPTPSTSAPATPAAPLVNAAPATAPPVTPVTAPTSVAIPSIGATLSVVPTGVTADGAMEIPDDPRVAGWYRFGPGPANDTGATVLAAHIDSQARVGPLAQLRGATPGDEIIVTTGDQKVRYVIERVDSYPKTVIDLDSVFDRDGSPRLHLVTCGGEWDPSTGSYEDNIIAVAVRADVS